ncbi:hypothetical protein BDR26DRAFT_922106 [Obelidium mucronatum]|nr:hypothetical protein BDR26DRAFT_922106 [Obelidium mucronatum]
MYPSSKYPKIPNGKLPDSIKVSKSSKWAVTEKVHGANFCISTADGTDFQFHKRTGLIEATDRFFGFRDSPTLLPELEPKLALLFKQIVSTRSSSSGTTTTVKVWGELCGGFYPTLSNETTNVPVQRGIHYSPSLQFYAFDISIIVSEGGILGGERLRETFLDYSVSLAHFERAGFGLYAKPLFVGDLSSCLSYPLGFDSHVPGWLKLPSSLVPVGTNKAEGIVVRLYHSGGTKKSESTSSESQSRPLVKFKIPEFSETDAFDNQKDREKLSYRKDRDSSAKGVLLSEKATAVLWELQAMATHERFQGIVSKKGRMEDMNREAIASWEVVVQEYVEALLEDIWEDYDCEYGTVNGNLSASEKAPLDQLVRDLCHEVVTFSSK